MQCYRAARLLSTFPSSLRFPPLCCFNNKAWGPQAIRMLIAARTAASQLNKLPFNFSFSLPNVVRPCCRGAAALRGARHAKRGGRRGATFCGRARGTRRALVRVSSGGDKHRAAQEPRKVMYRVSQKSLYKGSGLLLGL